jgi:hypothetical protein
MMQMNWYKNKNWFYSTAAVIFFSFTISVSAQTFGQNKVQYKNFHWKYIQSEHFDIYFYQGGEGLAEFAAYEVEKAYKHLSEDFRWKLSKRGILVIYNSHNDFQQTNVVQTYMPEGVGGVTELFKNRVVVPYEGDYAQFRHVIAHELTHAVMNDMLYGGSIQALITARATQVPTWFAEGLAEFESIGWDTKIDMLVRDVLVNATIEKERILAGLPYQFGTSFFRYIAIQYGRPKIAEILHKIRGAVSFKQALEKAMGMPLEDLLDDWYSALKKEYWPDIKDRNEPKDVAQQITGTEKSEKNQIFNTFVYGPTISPTGDKIAYILTQGLTRGIMILSLISGNKHEIIEGETDSHFEELHILYPKLSFSPDGRYLSFSAKGGDADVIHIYDTFEEKLQTLRFDMDGIFGSSWSPNGRYIAFRGIINGFSDLYIYDFQKQVLLRLMKDKFDDLQPAWTEDSKGLYFISDRGPYLKADSVGGPGYNMANIKTFNRDIYYYDINEGSISRITDTPYEERDPTPIDHGKKLLYISGQNGVLNIFLMDTATRKSYAITNFFDGVESISWSERSQQLVFSSFSRMNRNAFLIKNPMELKPLTLQDVINLQTRNILYKKEDTGKKKKGKKKLKPDQQRNPGNYSHYVFGSDRVITPEEVKERNKNLELPKSAIMDSSGNFIRKKYKLKFTPDLINGIVGYDIYYGVQGYTQMLFSDVLGDHQIMAGTNLVFDLRNSDIVFQYLYLPKRVDFGFTAVHLSDLFYRRIITSDGRLLDELIRYRTINVGVDLYFPLSKYARLQGGIQWRQVLEENQSPTPSTYNGNIHTTLINLAFVRDYSQWWYFAGPVKGLRYNISLSISPHIKSDTKEFYTVKFDFRKYFNLGVGYAFAWRMAGGWSTGSSPQRFFLGGISNWLNPTFKGGIRVSSDDIYFSEFVTPLRGAAYYELVGNGYMISNMELRFPFQMYLGIGFLPIQLSGIEGVAFMDLGSAWNNYTRWSMTYTNSEGTKVFKDFFSGMGFGIRAGFFGLLWRIDVAWKYDYNTFSRPRYYWSFGLDF